jgi:hypothetical protein
MTTPMIPNCWGQMAPATTGKMLGFCQGAVGAARLASDPLFYADLTLLNVMGGSRYRVTRADTGAELATGLVSGTVLTDVTLSGLAVYANPMLVNITVRNASGTVKYKIFDTAASMVREGASAYILQQED